MAIKISRNRLLWGAVSFVLLSGCTTSQAVRRWHAATEAEQKGELGQALRQYAVAYKLNSGLVGAELNRLRILAERPGQRDTISKRIMELQKKHPARAEVNLFAAAWALENAKLQDAAKLIELATDTTRADKPYLSLSSPKAPCGPYERLRGRLLVQLLRAQRAWQPLRQEVRIWTKRCPSLKPILLRARAEMYLAQGKVRPARNILGRMTTAGTRAPKHLSAEIAFVMGETDRLERLLRGRKDDRSKVLKAWIVWKQGHPVRTLARLRRPRKTKVQDQFAAELQGAALLNLSRWPEALSLLKLAVKATKTPRYGALFNLAIAAIKTGDLPLARNAFERAQATCSSCPGAKANLERLTPNSRR